MSEITGTEAPSAPAAKAEWQGYYINLERARERRSRMETMFGRFDLKDRYRRFPAVDGAALMRPAPCSPGEVGIFRSHLDVLSEAGSRGKAAHIVEDDIVFCDLTAPAIDNLVTRKIIDAFDIIFLETYIGTTSNQIRRYYAQMNAITEAGPLTSADQLQVLDITKVYQFGATSYLVSPRAARKLAGILKAEWARGPTLAVDDLYQAAARAGHLKLGCVFPFVTTIDMETSWSSSAARDGNLDQAMLQRLVRYTFFARADVAGVALPVLDTMLSRLPQPKADPALELYTRVVRYMMSIPPAPEKR